MNWLKLIRDIAPSLAQGGSLTRGNIIGIGGSVIATGAASGNMTTMAIGAAMYVLPQIWGLFVHTQASIADAAGQIPGCKVLVSRTDAPPSVVAVAKDPAVPNVKLA